jgi:hypothetical protein
MSGTITVWVGFHFGAHLKNADFEFGASYAPLSQVATSVEITFKCDLSCVKPGLTLVMFF